MILVPIIRAKFLLKMTVEKLIACVAQHNSVAQYPIIAYRDQLKKSEAWDKIAEVVGWSGE